MNSVTIIIPLYNSEKTIKRCIESCINQTFQNIEIIVINDGSTDNSRTILSECVRLFPALKIIDKLNQGLVLARISGIQHATGEYLFFIDSDDYIELDAIEILIQESENKDLVIGNFLLEDEKANENRFQYSNKLIYEASKEGMIYNYLSKNVIPSLCGRLIKKRCMIDVIIPSHITIGEDCIFNFMILEKKDVTVKLVDKAIYHYVQYSDSMINSRSKKTAEARLFYIKWIVMKVQSYRINSSVVLDELIAKFVLNEYFSYLRDGGKPNYDISFFNYFKMNIFNRKRINQLPIWRRYMLILYVYCPFMGDLYSHFFFVLRSLLKTK